jgi:retinol dehydrogenase-13
MACRDVQKCQAARDEIVADTGSKDVVVKHLDLASLDSVRVFAKDILAST